MSPARFAVARPISLDSMADLNKPGSLKQYYVAVGTLDAKLATLLDLIRAFESAAPLGLVVCCGWVVVGCTRCRSSKTCPSGALPISFRSALIYVNCFLQGERQPGCSVLICAGDRQHARVVPGEQVRPAYFTSNAFASLATPLAGGI